MAITEVCGFKMQCNVFVFVFILCLHLAKFSIVNEVFGIAATCLLWIQYLHVGHNVNIGAGGETLCPITSDSPV